MRLLADVKRGRWLAGVLATGLATAVVCAPQMASAQDEPAAPANGPPADYPMVLGAPYQIGATTFTPSDAMNYDIVGHASVSADVGQGVVAAHHTLPLPSYVEVTALDSGRTILVRVTRRGPMDGTQLIALSPDAAAHLGIMAGGAAVRVRRVNPPEADRALLREGQSAPERMATPPALLSVLKRRLGPADTVSLVSAGLVPSKPVTAGLPQPLVTPKPVAPPKPIADAKPPATTASGPVKPQIAPKPAQKPVLTPQPAMKTVDKPTTSAKPAHPKPATPPAVHPDTNSPENGGYVVQAGAFSVKTNADAVATKLGGRVVAAGKLWRVWIGAGTTRAKAEANLAKVKAAGYTGARIQRAD